MTQQTSTDQTYVIPTPEAFKPGRLALVYPLFAAIGYVLGLSMGGDWSSSLNVAFIGLMVAIPVFITCGIIMGAGADKRQRQVWATHTYAWYRKTFPAHAHSNGHVSCRHCGGHKMNVRNLMKRTYTRVHSCSQCGETLYFSPEKV